MFSPKISFRLWLNQLAMRSASPWLWLRGTLRQMSPGWKPRLVCMVFHDIAPERENLFRRQIEALRRHFEIVDLPEFGRRLRGESQHTEDAVLLTFDDAFASSMRVATILEELGLRGLFFVPTDFIDCSTPAARQDYIYQNLFAGQFPPGTMSPNLRPMTWGDLRDLVHRGHHIGSHTRRHCPLYILESEHTRWDELVASADILEQKLGCPVEAFAMPFGTVEIVSAEALITLAQRYRYIFTSIRGDNQHSPYWALCRETVMMDDSPYYVLLQAAGGLGWAYRKARARMSRIFAQGKSDSGRGGAI